MEELRIVLLSIAGLVFIVENYRRRQGDHRNRLKGTDSRSRKKASNRKSEKKIQSGGKDRKRP